MLTSRAPREIKLGEDTFARMLHTLEVGRLDNLTPQNKKLLWMMRVKAEQKHYQFAWQKNGQMFVRKAPGERAISIQCEADLDKIC